MLELLSLLYCATVPRTDNASTIDVGCKGRVRDLRSQYGTGIDGVGAQVVALVRHQKRVSRFKAAKEDRELLCFKDQIRLV